MPQGTKRLVERNMRRLSTIFRNISTLAVKSVDLGDILQQKYRTYWLWCFLAMRMVYQSFASERAPSAVLAKNIGALRLGWK